MLTELQKLKLTAMFNYYDLDGDGVLEKADYEEFARRTCEALGFAPGSPEYDQVYAANVDAWENETLQRFDKDGDGRVSLEEHLEAHEALLSDKELFNQIVMRDSEGLLGLWDQDGDGKLSSQEYAKALWCYGVEKEAAREAFQHLDRNGSGYLSIEEILKALEEFYQSDDPEAPGNWLMGPY